MKDENMYEMADSLNYGLIAEQNYFFLNVWPDFIGADDAFKLFKQTADDNGKAVSEKIIFQFGIDTAKQLIKILSLFTENKEAQ